MGRCGIRRRPRRGYTLLEMLTTVAALIIVLGLMVSLARSVRSASAQELTKDLLRKLDVLMDQYYAANGRLPDIAPLVPAEEWQMTEPVLQRNAYQNNRQLVGALKAQAAMDPQTFVGLPDTVFNDAILRDAWSTPIVYMPRMHPSIGTAPQNRRFFFSAGPDGQFLTQEDNLYSYEETPLAGGEKKDVGTKGQRDVGKKSGARSQKPG
ncbi:MAG TPA: type II secretion system protein [Humisphaera sp.]|nr:type II secretion system protein [Humisphaera sp.]